MKQIYSYIAILFAGLVLGLMFCKSCVPTKTEKVIEVQKDTIVRVDTIVVYMPSEERSEPMGERLVVVRDTLTIRDTLYMALEWEKKSYRGEGYYAEVSGHQPSLDYIEVLTKTKVVTKTETREVVKRQSNYLTIGLESEFYGSDYFHLPLYVEYQRMLHKNFGVKVRLGYDIPTQTYGVGLGMSVRFGW